MPDELVVRRIRIAEACGSQGGVSHRAPHDTLRVTRMRMTGRSSSR
jgi:hypothetical protein